MMEPLRKVWQLLKKLNTELSYDLAILLLDTYPRTENYVHAKPCT